MDMENVWRQFDTLPAQAKREVIDFMAFLHTRYQRQNIEMQSKTVKLSEEPFVGIWKDRGDLKDSVAWVRKARKNEWRS
ncbi:MAG: DUF2281 domain-containing protein [bacterium]